MWFDRRKRLLRRINALEPAVEKLPKEAFPARTAGFRSRLQEELPLESDEAPPEKVRALKKELLNELLPEAFALVREAARRTIGLRHHDVQLLAGIVVHDGAVADIRSGEGKTLVATAPAYLNALTGKGVQIIAANDYLAKRDCEWMGPIYKYLGLTAGYILHDMDNEKRREAYRCDVTYITNNELGFGYLRDNMVVRAEDRVQRPLHYAIVDGVDSILIDEARTPLIISGPAEESPDRYVVINRIIPHLKVRFVTEDDEVKAKSLGEDLGKGYDAVVDKKNHNATLTDQGIGNCEKLLGLSNLYDDLAGAWVHHITQALRAHHLYKRDVDYVVRDGEVVIIDEFTGRLTPGRRWPEGLHEAVEAKEQLPPREENQTLATITFQNFFKMYEKLGGMTGTGVTEADEFHDIYELEVVEIPTNRPNIREDRPDVIFLNQKGKWNATVSDIDENWRNQRPVLVGTRSLEKSNLLSAILHDRDIPHQVLTGKNHEMDAQILAQAGKTGSVTIATDMAGRGLDISLGGDPPDEADRKAVLDAGGLYVIGTERYDSRHRDEELRGICGRRGEPGETRFYLALDDELMRQFGSDRMQGLMARFGATEDEPIDSPLVSKQIEGAQRRVETHNSDIRRQLVDYDNVMNKQREAVYSLRNRVLEEEDVSATITRMIEDDIEQSLSVFIPSNTSPKEWDLAGMSAHLRRTYGVESALISGLSHRLLLRDIKKTVLLAYERRVREFEGYDFREIEGMVLLQMIDQAWKTHLYDLDQLKKHVHLRAHRGKDPKIEYQKESFDLFERMLDLVRERTIDYIFHIRAPRRAPRPKGRQAGEEHRPDDDSESPPDWSAGRPVRPIAPPPSRSGSGRKPLPPTE